MEQLGGLIHRMPLTAFAFLSGCIAISALPPLNGFVSEWLTFQAILLSPELPQWGLKLIVPAVGAMLALSAALAAACFVKAFGITFLGRPRTPAAAAAQRDRQLLAAAMFAFCWRCACWPASCRASSSMRWRRSRSAWSAQAHAARRAASPGCRSCRSPRAAAPTTACWSSSSSPSRRSSPIEIIHRFASRAVRRGPAWDCGFPDPSPATQYTADSFAQPIRRVFGDVVFRAREHVDMPPPGDARPARLTVTLRDLVWDALYAPLGRLPSRSPPRSSTVCSS